MKPIIRRVLAIGLLAIPALSIAQDTIVAPATQNVAPIDSSLPAEAITPTDGSNKKVKRIPPWFARRVKVKAGVFFPVNNTVIKVGNKDETFGTEVDFEDDLGFRKSTTTFLGHIEWRASRRSKFELSYFNLRREQSYVLQRTLEFGENIYPINASVSTFFENSIYRFSYGYAIFIDPKYEFGLMIGSHIIRAETGINFIGATANITYNDGFDFTAPLPDVGIWGGYAFTDKLALKGNVSYLQLKVGDIDGRITSYDFSVLYAVIPNLELSAGYAGLSFDVEVEKRLLGTFEWGYSGPSFSVAYSFGSVKPFK